MTVSPASVLGRQSMCGRLLEVLVIAPQGAMWSHPAGYRELGYLHPPEPDLAARQHRALRSELAGFGARVREAAPTGLSADAVYCHDASFPTPRGMVLMRMGKPARAAEPEAHRALYREMDIPVIGAIEAPGVMEGGDLVWLDERTVLAGEGYRTDAAGIAQLAALLAPDGVEVIASALPHGDGPACCLHLMSLISVLDSRTMVADPRFLAVPTMKLLEDRRFRLIPIVDEERETMAANVLALGHGELLAIEANERTNERLEGAGFRVRTYPGSEISQNGSGGPTCLTRPIRRAQ